MNFNSRICRRVSGRGGRGRWIRVKVFVSNTNSKFLTVSCIIYSENGTHYKITGQERIPVKITISIREKQ